MKIETKEILLIIVLILVFIYPATLLGLDRDSAFRFPVRAYNDGNYRVAIRGCNQFLENFPEDERVPRLIFWKGEAYRHLENSEKAYESFYKLQRKYPNFQTREVAVRLAYLAEQLGREDEILQLMNARLLQEAPTLQNYMIKWLYRKKGKKEEIFSRLSVLPPGSLSDLARNYLNHFKKSQNLTELEEKLSEGRWTPDIWNQMRSKNISTRKNLLLLAARRIWQKNNYDLLLNFSARVPESWHSVEFSLYRAEAAVKKGRYELAENIYRNLQDSSAYREEIIFSLGWVLYKQDNLSEALGILEKSPWDHKSELAARARRLMADIHLIKNNSKRASRHYSKAIEFSDSASFRNVSRYWLGWSYFEGDMIREAYDTFRAVSAEGPIRLADIYQVRGKTALELSEYQEAEDYFNRALEHTDDSQRITKLRYELAQTYYEWGRVKTAFDMLLKLNKEKLPVDLQAPVRFGLGRAALEVDRPELGWSVFKANREELLRQFPVEYRFFASQAAIEVDLYERALVYLNELIDQFPNSHFIRPALRMSFKVELKKLSEGEEDIAEKVRDKINKSPADMRLSMLQDWARVEREKGRLDKARSLYEEVLLKAEDSAIQARVINNIVAILIEQEKDDRAAGFLEKQLAKLPVHPASAEAVYQLLSYDYQNRNTTRLQGWLTRFFEHFPQSPYHGRAYFMQAELKRNEGAVSEAVDFYKKSLAEAKNRFLKLRSHFRIGQMQLELQNYRDAYDNLAKVAENPPSFIDKDILNEMMADAALGFDNFTLVEKHLNKLTELKDRHQLIKARVHYNKGELDVARDLLEDISPEEDSILAPAKKFWLGRIAAEKEDYELAVELWYQVLYLYPDWKRREELIFRLASLEKARGEKEAARTLKETLKQEFPDSDYLEAL